MRPPQKLEEVAKGVFAIYGEGFCSNTFVLAHGKRALLIDAGSGSTVPALDYMALSGMSIEKVLLTHGHADHVHGLNYISAEGYLHEADLDRIRELNSFAGPFSPPVNISPLSELGGGELKFGAFSLRAIRSPGHTPGSVCFLEKRTGALFTGDTLFANKGVGRTDLPLGSREELERSLKALAKVERKLICPGHGPVEQA
jgi:glyoxylase-like metal-dependent hydrolase (beta-lactamase superfamily II)